MSIQKCSGRLCEYVDVCLHAVEGRKKTRTRGKWIRVDLCRFGLSPDGGKTYTLPPFSELIIKEVGCQ